MKSILVWLALSLITISCSLETSSNGSLDALWHLETIDTLATNGQLNLKKERRFWAFQMRLMQLSNYNISNGLVIMRFEKTNQTLRCYAPYYNNRPENDPIITTPETLFPWGINKLEETFQIEKLTGKSLILRSETLRLTFSKF